MRKSRIPVLVAVVLLLLASFTVFSAGLAQAASDTECVISNFVAAVRIGPDTDWSVMGDLHLMIAADGALSGFVSNPEDDQTVLATVIGQLTGHGLNLAFDIGQPVDPADGADDFYLFGNGTMVNSPADCGGPLGGVFAGPRLGDMGDWGTCSVTGHCPPKPKKPITHPPPLPPVRT